MTLRSLMLVLLLAAGTAQAAAPPVDPPARVARLSYADGDVTFSPGGEDGWYRAQLNRPQVAGDRLWIGGRSRAELELGGAALRFDQGTSVQILTLDDRDVQVELTQGTLNLHVRRTWQGQSYEIATPTLALVVREPGDFRIDVDERGRWTEVVAWRGRADIYGDRARFSVREGDAVRFEDPRLRGYQQFAPPPADSFDLFAVERNRREERSLARRYVPEDMIGYADLDDYGRWSNDAEYGALWYPRVAAGWAPYRDGQWIWQDPWGWTWVDAAPWGFAPFHYGRWLRVGGRWAWLPAQQRSRPVYAPALVAFVGGGSGSIGWFPLGPHDVYEPGYRASRGYYDRVNDYRWIDARVSGDVWNGYSSGRNRNNRQRYGNRDRESMTMVARDSFVNGRSTSRSRVQPGANFDASAQASALANMAPVQRSLAGGATAATAAPDERLFDRRVMARRAPQASDVPFERREQQLQRNPGQPIASDELARMRGATPATEVQVVGEAGPDLRGQAGAGGRTNQGSRRDEPPADAGRGQGGRDRGRDTGSASAEAQRQADADRVRADQQAAQDAQRAAEQQQRDTERQQQQAAMEAQRQADAQQRDGERQRREADRVQQQTQMDAQREAERQQRDAEQQQRDAERQQQQAAMEAQRAAQQQQAEAERAQRDAEAAQRQQQEAAQTEKAEQAEREQRARYEQEQRDREAQRQQQATEAAQRQAEQEQQQAQREAEQAQREAAQQAQREAEQAQREAEKERQEAEREAEREQKEQEKEQEKEERSRDRDAGGEEQQQ